jgi:hypothetical protein
MDRVSDQVAGFPFSIQILVSDSFGNVFVDKNFTVSIFALYLSETGLKSKEVFVYQKFFVNPFEFSDLVINNTGQACYIRICVYPSVILQLVGKYCLGEGQCLSVQSVTNSFLVKAGNASKLVTTFEKSRLWLAFSFEKVLIWTQDSFGNIVHTSPTCPEVCVSLLVNGSRSGGLLLSNRSSECVQINSGQASFQFAISLAEGLCDLQFYCHRDIPGDTDISLIYGPIQMIVLEKIVIIDQPHNTSAGQPFSSQPALRLCYGTQCSQSLMCCQLEVNATAYLIQTATSSFSDTIKGSFDVPVFNGVARFTDLQVRTVA